MGGQSGNRQDNRQRGNAAQLLEKYKSMARDAQLAGDRVQTEYYLQFADHYYRVLGESRARFEEQRRQRGEDLDEDDNEDDLIEADGDGRDDDQRFDRGDRQDRPERAERQDRPERQERAERGDSQQRGRRYARDERPGDDGPQRNGAERPSGNVESIAFDALPPAIGADSAPGAPALDDVADEPEAARPRRRRTRARPDDGDGEIAPAA